MRGRDQDRLEDLLQRGFLPYAASPPTRAVATRELPAAVAAALAHNPSSEALARLQERLLREHWPALLERQAGGTGHGWDALMGAAAVVLELVLGALPADVEKNLPPLVQERFSELRRPFQRFALVVERNAQASRIFVSTGEAWPGATELRCPPSLELYPGLHFWLARGLFDGRSHTLMLALLALEQWGALALPTRIPLAATGAIAADGKTIAPVESLAEKRRAWFAREPGGLLISAPPRSVDELKVLLRSPHSQGEVTRYEEPKEDDPTWAQWLVAGSLEEVRAKLDVWSASRSGGGDAIPSWDGRALTPKELMQPTLEWEAHESRPTRELSYQDRILSALWHLVTERPAQCGVIVYGEPGIGKSVLSRVLERRFTAGLLGALGFAVRRSARELAEDVEAMPGAALDALLARREPRRIELFRILITQHRLILILDGLDEVAARLLPSIARPLRDAKVLFVAMSRPVRQGHDALPPHLSLKINPLDRYKAGELLKTFGRDDLSAQIEHVFPSYSYRESERHPIGALCRTPLHLNLLASVIPRGARVGDLDTVDLYRRAFAGLLEQAVSDGRLRPDEAELLRRQGHAIVGELALAWLRSPHGALTDAEVSARLERVGLVGRDALHMQRALEFGYLLTPGADNLEFTHRTIAEWAAALALAHRVRRRLTLIEEQNGSITAADRNAAEKAELAPFLSAEGPLSTSSAWQLLRFYAASSVAPLGLIEALVGPAAALSWKSESDVGQAFSAALELAASARWEVPEEARIAFGLFARARLFTAPENKRFGAPMLDDHSKLDRFVRAIGSHLPARLEELIALAARTQEQRTALESDPTRLLPFCPKELHTIFEPLLDRGAPAQQAAILERYVQWEVGPPWDWAQRLAEELPARIEAVCPPPRPIPLDPAELEKSWTESQAPDEMARRQVVSALERVEAALYISTGRGWGALPWSAVRRRLLDWPHHLEAALFAWFRDGGPEVSRSESLDAREFSDRAGPHRREALSLLVTRLGEMDADLIEQCRRAATSPRGPSIASYVYYRIDDEDSSEPWRTFSRIAERAGWDPGRERKSFGRDEPLPEAAQIVDTFQAFKEKHQALTRVLRALLEAGRLDDLLGQLWPVWRPASKERRVLLEMLLAERHLPPCIHIEEVLLNPPPDRLGLPYALSPRSWKVILPKHESEWREIARSGWGYARFLALLWCAERDERNPVDALAAAASGADPELAELISKEVSRLAAHASPADEPVRVPERVDALPLAYRARVNAPGWRQELLSALEAAPKEEAAESTRELIGLARDYDVHEALPNLKRRFKQQPSRPIADAVAKLMDSGDREGIEMLLDAGMVEALPKAALERLTLADLSAILSMPRVPYNSSSIWARVARFGPPAHALLRGAFERRRELLDRAQAEAERRFGTPFAEYSSPDGSELNSYEASQWVETLGPLVINTVDIEATPMSSIVDLLFAIVGGDRHEITSTPGPLGSEFDEPHDREYSSRLRGVGSIDAAKEALRRRLERHPEELPALDHLLDHPSETLHLHAFKMLARRTPPHEVARLGVRAFEAHLRSTQTKTEGETLGILLAQTVSGGSGSIDVRLPEVGQSLVKAVRRHLTHADRDVLFELTRHPTAALRAIACAFIADLGTPDWAAGLAHALEDPSPRVVMAAMRAWLALDRGSFGAAVSACSRKAWGAEHYRALLAWLVPRSEWFDEGDGGKKGLAAALPEPALRVLSAEAVESACKGSPEEWPDPSVPSLLEELLETVDEAGAPPAEGPLSNSWLRERARTSPDALKAALYRALARRGAAEVVEDLEPLLGLLASPEAKLAAEILPSVGGGDPDQIVRFWGAELAEDAWSKLFELWPRLLFMLERAPADYAPLLPRLLPVIRDDLEGSLTEESEKILERMRHILKRWGPSGAWPLVDCIRRRPPAHGSFYAEELLVDVYRACDEVKTELLRLAQEQPEHSLIGLNMTRLPQAEVMTRLRCRLLGEILPVAWSDPQGEAGSIRSSAS